METNERHSVSESPAERESNQAVNTAFGMIPIFAVIGAVLSLLAALMTARFAILFMSAAVLLAATAIGMYLGRTRVRH